jgi:hypothetical protein
MGSVSNLTSQDVADIKQRLLSGEYQHDIAAKYGLNQGRISEIKTGKRFQQKTPPAQQATLF